MDLRRLCGADPRGRTSIGHHRTTQSGCYEDVHNRTPTENPIWVRVPWTCAGSAEQVHEAAQQLPAAGRAFGILDDLNRGESSMPVRRHMHRRETPRQLRFITFSCYRRMQLLGNGAIRDLFVTHLAAARERCGFTLQAYVIMPEHVHLMLCPPQSTPVGEILRCIKQPVAQRVLSRWRELNAPVLPRITDARGDVRFWQRGGGYDRNICDEYVEKVHYMHMNPVVRGLAQAPTDWKWSSARWYDGIRDGPLSIDGAVVPMEP